MRRPCPMCEHGYIPVEEVREVAPGTIVIEIGYVECACGSAGGEAG